MKKRSIAFTLVELLIVMAIILLIVGIMIPVINNALRNGKRVTSIANAKQIANALQMYAFDDSKRLLPEAGYMEVGGAKGGGDTELDSSRPLAGYIPDPKTFFAPVDSGCSGGGGVPAASRNCFEEHGSSFAYPAGDVRGIEAVSGIRLSRITNSSLKVVIFEAQLASGQNERRDQWYGREGGVAGFLDGHAIMLEENAESVDPTDNGYY